jgi:hypothetical protein
MSGGLFEGIKQWELEWRGHKGKLPVFYQDASSMTAIFTGRTERVRELLPRPEMRPVELLPGRALVAITAFEYRRSDIDPYNELSIAFPIAYGCVPIPGLTALSQVLRRCFTAYVWQLPVTTEIARRTGVGLYGYPKFIADISFERTPQSVTCALSEQGRPILTLRGRVLPTARGRRLRFRTYSLVDGIPLVANVLTDPRRIAESMHGDSAVLEVGGEHVISSTLRGLGLSPRPVLYHYCPELQAILFAGRNLADS